VEIFSAGTSGSTAERFFQRIARADITTVVDTRLNNVSQLAGFSKYPDLPYFLRTITETKYIHELLLAPEKDALKAYRAKSVTWGEYERQYVALLERRRASERIDRSAWGSRPLLLCSEPTAARCHRRLAADYLAAAWGVAGVARIEHL
jgi:uncharacterized protein (DUF488 family)